LTQRITNYESSRKTKFYDRTNDAIRADYISLDEIERILIWSADFGEAEWGSGARGFAAAPRCRSAVPIRISCDTRSRN